MYTNEGYTNSMDCIKDEEEQPIYSEDVIRYCYKYYCLHNLNKSAAPIHAFQTTQTSRTEYVYYVILSVQNQSVSLAFSSKRRYIGPQVNCEIFLSTSL